MITVVTGGVRSGKSAFALQLARESGGTVIYVATAALDPADAEMAARVARHRADRGSMPTIETGAGAPALTEALAAAGPGEVLVVDSLGTWLTAELLALDDGTRGHAALAAGLEARAATLGPALARTQAGVVLVAEETGWGVVPPSLLGRLFRDQLGRTTAELAGAAGRAFVVIAGYAIDLKAGGRRVSG